MTEHKLDLSCFKAYDIRGELGVNFDEDIAYKIARSFAEIYKPKSVVIGRDVRLSSEAIKDGVARGLVDAGSDVVDIGITGTEEVYFATSHLNADGGFEITASHNPINYNGLKIVGKNSTPIGEKTGLDKIKAHIENDIYASNENKGNISFQSNLDAYIEHLISYIDLPNITPQKILTNPGNGAAQHVIDALEDKFNSLNIPITFIKIHHEHNGKFPNGIPNPMIQENRTPTIEAVKKHQANIGIAWDGDFDRCFFFDEKGNYVENYYIVGLLSKIFALKEKNANIIHDPRLYWNTIEILKQAGGKPIISKSGHSFFKAVMREHNGIYGGEISGHHYFREFMYCDSGMIPALLIINYLCIQKKPLSDLVSQMESEYPISGEINLTVDEPAKALNDVLEHFKPQATKIDRIDGIGLEFKDWRFNLRPSNTEPLIRLNIETKNNQSAIEDHINNIKSII